jgi:hypothetical protein
MQGLRRPGKEVRKLGKRHNCALVAHTRRIAVLAESGQAADSAVVGSMTRRTCATLLAGKPP